MIKNKGFSLIELVVVIVILGILSATAIPKFMDLQSDARASSLHGLEAAIKSAMTMIYSKSIVMGVEKFKISDNKFVCSLGTSCVDSEKVYVHYGYPIASSKGILRSVDDPVVETPTSTTSNLCSGADWCYTNFEDDNIAWVAMLPKGKGPNPSRITIDDDDVTVTGESECFLIYYHSKNDAKAPKVKLFTKDC
ncbi:MAG: type II secretion system protein [Succinivibrionaceae bacterium]